MQQMKQEGNKPDIHTYTSFISACCKAGDMQVKLVILIFIFHTGFTMINLIRMAYDRLGSILYYSKIIQLFVILDDENYVIHMFFSHP